MLFEGPGPITSGSTPDITQLLADWSNGDPAALALLMPLVYAELQQIAHRYLRQERTGHTLQTTDLVHEAFLKLVKQRKMQWHDRAHFFAIAATVMRRLLVDHARTCGRGKRGGGAVKLPIEVVAVVSDQRLEELVVLDEALRNLAVIDPRKSRVVELRVFGGLSNEEIGVVLGVSPSTVMRDWNFAEAWLRRWLAQPGPPPESSSGSS